MKRSISFLLAALLLTALLSGCRSVIPIPPFPSAPAAPTEPEPAPVEEPTLEEEFYEGRTSVVTGAVGILKWRVDRLDLSDGLPVDMYFEIPVLEEDGAGIERINADLAAFRQSYVEDFVPDVLETVRSAREAGALPTKDMRYTDVHRADMHTCAENLVSLSIDYEWWMGGTTDYGSVTFTYDPRTGERLYLRDVLYGTDDQIKESIVTALTEQYPGVEEAGILDETPMDAIRGMDLDAIDFYVECDAVHVTFSKYEIAYGAAGAFDVLLPDVLNLPG